MTDLLTARTDLLESILKKESEGKLDWTFDEKQKSAQVEFGKFEINVDASARPNGISLKVWLFDENGEQIDSFPLKEVPLASAAKGLDRFYPPMMSLYNKIKEREAVKKIAPALDSLKNL